MRVTTQMLNASMRRAKLSTNNMSLVNYLNGGSAQSNNLMSRLNKSNAASQIQKRNYEKLTNTAEDLQKAADVLNSKKLYEEAKESGDNQAICSQAKSLVEYYNDTVKALKNTTSPLNKYYKEALSEVPTEDKEALKGIGITLGKDGTLSIDEDKLKAADSDTLQAVLGGKFSAKISFLSDRIGDNAKVNAGGVVSQYNSMGSSYFTEANKFNFWG